MGFDEPVTHSVPATLGPGTPLTASRIIDTLIDAKLIDPVRDGEAMLVIEPTLDAARAATRVEADLRHRVAVWMAGDDALAAVLHSDRTLSTESARYILARLTDPLCAFLAATEAPREVWTDVPGHGDTQYLAATEAPREGSIGDVGIHGIVPGGGLLRATEDRDEPTMKDRARARMHGR